MTLGPEAMRDALPEEDPRLIAAYRGSSTETPDPQIDALIRAAARRSAGARPRALGKPWQAPLALAATVVLSATVVYWTARDEGIAPPSRPVADVPAVAEKAPPASLGEPVAALSANRPPPRKPEPQHRAEKYNASSKPAAAPAKPDVQARMSAPSTPATAPLAKEAGLAATPPESATVGQTAADDSRRDEYKKLEGDVVRGARGELRSKEKASLKQAAPGVSDLAELPVAPAPARAQSQEFSSQDAARRIEEIRQHLREGKRREALESLKDLRRAHPDYAIPEDLSELVKEISSTER